MASILPLKSWAPAEPSPGEFVIRPPERLLAVNVGELWRHRELMYFLAWRDIKVRYKQTVLGVSWVIIQPVTTMLIFNIFFGNMAQMTSDGIPYPVFSFAGLLPWLFFSNGLNLTANSLVGNANLVTKVYFPRLLLPMAGVVSNLVDFLLAFTVMLGMMAWYGIMPTFRILLLPIPVLLALFAALGAGLWLSALNVKYRDVRHTLPFLCQIWMFSSPVIYPASLLGGKWRLLFALNPMVGAIECFRWALLGTGTMPLVELTLSMLMTAVLMVTGVWYFRSMERTFADFV